MSNPVPVQGVHFNVGAVKKTPLARTTCGDKIGAQAPTSPLYQDPEVKTAVDNTVAKTAETQTKIDDFNKAHAAYVTAKTALGLVLAGWDSVFDVLVSVANKHCTTAAQAAALGMPIRGPMVYSLDTPLQVLLTQDFKKNLLHVRVKRAPGMRSTVVQVSRDPITATSWQELDGDGLIRDVPNPAPGLWYVRAAHKRARATSDFTVPVSITIK